MDILQAYWQSVTAFQLLTEQDEQRLGDLIREANDPAAKKKMIECNLRLVVKIASQFAGRGQDFLDLIQDGNRGLIKAVNHFDPGKGRFGIYAAWWIKQEIVRGLLNKPDSIRIPVWMSEYVARLSRVRASLFGETGEEPSLVVIAKEMQIEETLVREILRAVDVAKTTQHSSLCVSPQDDEFDESRVEALADLRLNPLDVLEAKEHLASASYKLYSFLNRVYLILSRSFKKKPRQHFEIFAKRYRLDSLPDSFIELLHYKTIALTFSISKQRVEQIISSCWEKLREAGIEEDEDWLIRQFSKIQSVSDLVGQDARAVIEANFKPYKRRAETTKRKPLEKQVA